MDLIHDDSIASLRGQYTGAMIAVSLVTYVVAVALVLLVDRRKIMPYFLDRLSTLSSAIPVPGKVKGLGDKGSSESGGRGGDRDGGRPRPPSLWWPTQPVVNIRRRSRQKQDTPNGSSQSDGV